MGAPGRVEATRAGVPEGWQEPGLLVAAQGTLCARQMGPPIHRVWGIRKKKHQGKKKSEHKTGHLGQYFTSGEGLALPPFPPLKRAKSGPR